MYLKHNDLVYWCIYASLSLDELNTWWRHQIEAFSTLLALYARNSPHKDLWSRALMFSLIYAWINCWVNNCEAGDLRRHRAHYDIIVILWTVFFSELFYSPSVWALFPGWHMYVIPSNLLPVSQASHLHQAPVVLIAQFPENRFGMRYIYHLP